MAEAPDTGAELLGALLALSAEAETRPQHHEPIRVVHAETHPTGTISVIVAASASPLYERVATPPEDAHALTALREEATSAFLDALAAFVGAADETWLAHIVTVHYGDKPLGAPIALDEGDAYGDVFAYTGGTLDADRFVLRDHAADADATPPAGLVVVSPPELSDTERQALALVPADAREANLSAQPTAAAVRRALQEAARAARQRARGGIFATEARLAEADLGELPPEPTVGELLRRRRDLLERGDQP